MKYLYVNPYSAAENPPYFSSVQHAFDYIDSCGCDENGFYETVVLTLDPGIYSEILSYNSPNALIMQAKKGLVNTDCIISAENCEAFHKDTENRAVFVIGPRSTHVTLNNFTIENTHIKTDPDAALGNQAEALCFHNYNGTLIARGMRFLSRQDTIHVKGQSWFYQCFILGDVDFIWGYCDTALFEDCEIHVRKDNRGEEFPAYVLQSRALAGKKGFVFLNCRFTASKYRKAPIYIARTSGTGRADSADRWDSIALINCSISREFDPQLWTDDGGKTVYPNPATVHTGWREYGTLYNCPFQESMTRAAGARHPASKQLTEKDYHSYYKNRLLILNETNLVPYVKLSE